MSKITQVFLASMVALIVAACSSAPAKVERVAECVFPGSDKAAPVWVCDAPVVGVTVGAVGSAARSDAGIAFMKQMAAVDASVQLAQKMKVQVQNKIRLYAEATGAGSKDTVDHVIASVTKQITHQTLQGSKIFKYIVAPDGTMFVLVVLDEAAVQNLTETAVRISVSNDQAAWQHFKTQKNQDELASEIARQQAGMAAQ